MQSSLFVDMVLNTPEYLPILQVLACSFFLSSIYLLQTILMPQLLRPLAAAFSGIAPVPTYFFCCAYTLSIEPFYQHLQQTSLVVWNLIYLKNMAVMPLCTTMDVVFSVSYASHNGRPMPEYIFLRCLHCLLLTFRFC